MRQLGLAALTLLAAGCLPTSFGPAGGAAADVAPEALAVAVLEGGAYSGIDTARQVVIRDRAAFAALLEQVSIGRAPTAPPPAVDFAQEMVLGVFMGMRRTGGYRTEIVGVDELPAEIVVRYAETSPPEGMMVTQAISSPYQLVKVRRSDKPVRFVRS